MRVVARIKAKPETVDRLGSLLASLVAPTRKEAGCIAYELLQSEADPTDFTFVEEWTSGSALDAHMQTDHISKALSMIPDLTAAPPDIRRYRLLA